MEYLINPSDFSNYVLDLNQNGTGFLIYDWSLLWESLYCCSIAYAYMLLLNPQWKLYKHLLSCIHKCWWTWIWVCSLFCFLHQWNYYPYSSAMDMMRVSPQSSSYTPLNICYFSLSLWRRMNHFGCLQRSKCNFIKQAHECSHFPSSTLGSKFFPHNSLPHI